MSYSSFNFCMSALCDAYKICTTNQQIQEKLLKFKINRTKSRAELTLNSNNWMSRLAMKAQVTTEAETLQTYRKSLQLKSMKCVLPNPVGWKVCQECPSCSGAEGVNLIMWTLPPSENQWSQPCEMWKENQTGRGMGGGGKGRILSSFFLFFLSFYSVLPFLLFFFISAFSPTHHNFCNCGVKPTREAENRY